MQIIPPDINIDFMKASRVAGLISAAVVLACMALLVTKGLNLGIDFHGGVKIIAAFKAGDQGVNRNEIRKAVRDLAERELGRRDIQVEVQDFFSGASSADGVHRYQILTELTSFMSDERRDALAKDLRAAFGNDLRSLNVVREGEDKFHLNLKNKAPVTATAEKIKKVFAKHKINEVQVLSALERNMDLEHYREIDMQVREGTIDELTIKQRQQEHEKRKAEKLLTSGDDEYEIRIEQIKGQLETVLAAEFKDTFRGIDSFTSISPSVGKEMFNSGLVAMLYAILGILAYIWLRFDIRYSPGAVVALIHDVTITLGIFALFEVKFSLATVAALLTVIGYSLNDTIVVYDRIRETMGRLRATNIRETVNRSINETLSRTILTSLTTLFVVLCLLFLAGGLIRDFALALTIGIVVGTYSSIYVASPLVVWLDRIVESKKQDDRGGRRPAPRRRGAPSTS